MTIHTNLNNYILKCSEMIEHSEWYWKCEHAFIFTYLLRTSFAPHVNIHYRKATQKSYLDSVPHNFLIIKNLRFNVFIMYYTHYFRSRLTKFWKLDCSVRYEKSYVICFPTVLCIQFHNDVLVPPAEIATHTFFSNKVVALTFLYSFKC